MEGTVEGVCSISFIFQMHKMRHREINRPPEVPQLLFARPTPEHHHCPAKTFPFTALDSQQANCFQEIPLPYLSFMMGVAKRWVVVISTM